MSEYEIKSRFDEVEMIEISKLYHHPLNPRKDLGDLEELTKSIEKNGIMQNLTVVPGEPCQKIPNGGYYVLIGNRRFEASKAAGFEGMPDKERDVFTFNDYLYNDYLTTKDKRMKLEGRD